MTYFKADTMERWSGMCAVFLASHAAHSTLADVRTGADAWTVAHRAGVTREAYAYDRAVTDAHIKTALQRIMPNAVFKDSYRY